MTLPLSTVDIACGNGVNTLSSTHTQTHCYVCLFLVPCLSLHLIFFPFIITFCLVIEREEKKSERKSILVSSVSTSHRLSVSNLVRYTKSTSGRWWWSTVRRTDICTLMNSSGFFPASTSVISFTCAVVWRACTLMVPYSTVVTRHTKSCQSASSTTRIPFRVQTHRIVLLFQGWINFRPWHLIRLGIDNWKSSIFESEKGSLTCGNEWNLFF